MRAVALTLGVLLLAGATAAQGGAFRVAQPNAALFPEVSVYAYPSSPRGVPLGVPAGGFRVEEDGTAATVIGVEAGGGALDVCLALDRSPSMDAEGKLSFAKAAAVTFVNQLSPNDRAALVTFSSGNALAQGLTSDTRALAAAIMRTEVGGDSTTFLDAVYWSIAQVAVRAHGRNSMVSSGPARPEARRLVLALTDGQDRSSRVLIDELVQLARQNGVGLCMVALGRDAETSRMQYLARETGGVFLQAPQPADLQRLYSSLAAQLRREYRVTFVSPRPAADGSRRQVRVTLPTAGLTADTWYMTPTPGSLLSSRPHGTAAGLPMAAGSANSPRGPNLLVIGIGIAGAGALLLGVAAWRARRRPSELVDSNPRLDLLPLWVREGETRVGRSTDCELILDSREVSRLHARIEAWDGVYRILDEGSSNGTFVNGRRVRRRAEIRVGDVVRFGDREFRFAGRQRVTG